MLDPNGDSRERLPDSSAGQPRARHSEALVVFAILALGAAVRALFLASWASNPLFLSPVGDELNFHLTALGLIGQGPPPDAFLYQPFYSFYLAAIYSLAGPDVALVRTLQLFIGLGTIGLFYGLARELAGPWAGRLAALLVALYGPLVFFEGQMLAPALVVPLVAGGLWCLLRAGLRQRVWLLAPAGLLMGLAVMARPNLIAVLPVGLVWWLVRVRALRLRAIGAGLALVGLLVGLSPAWIHNAIQGQQGVLVSTAGGLTFYLGNNPQATGRFHVPRGEKIDASSHQAYRRSWHVLAERAEGRSLSPAEVSAHWWRRGAQFWAEHPGQALALVGTKLLMAVNHDEMPIHHPYDAVAALVPMLGWLLGFGVVFPFAVMGLWIGWRARPGAWLLAACALAYWASLAVFYVADRYRVVLIPMLIVLAALGMVELAKRFAAGSLRKAGSALVVLLVAFALTQPAFVSEANRTKALFGLYNLMGKVEGDLGNLVRAEQYFGKAIEIAGPERGSIARVNLGQILERRGEIEAATEMYRAAAGMDRENRSARRRLAQLAERSGRLAEAIDWWRQAAALDADPSAAEEQINRLQGRLAPSQPEPDPQEPHPQESQPRP